MLQGLAGQLLLMSEHFVVAPYGNPYGSIRLCTPETLF